MFQYRLLWCCLLWMDRSQGSVVLLCLNKGSLNVKVNLLDKISFYVVFKIVTFAQTVLKLTVRLMSAVKPYRYLTCCGVEIETALCFVLFQSNAKCFVVLAAVLTPYSPFLCASHPLCCWICECYIIWLASTCFGSVCHLLQSIHQDVSR
jgi:hypothetical protein